MKVNSSKWVGLIFIAALFSCAGYKHLPTDEKLYTGLGKVVFEKVDQPETWELEEPATKRIESLFPIWVTPNGSFFGMAFLRIIPLRLMIYNAFYTEDAKGFKSWVMRNFGEPPISIESVNPSLRVKKIENILFNYGHFGVEGGFELKSYGDNRKARVRYHFKLPKAYTIRRITYQAGNEPEYIRNEVEYYLEEKLAISFGDEFNLSEIEQEKKNLWNDLENKGYLFLDQQHLLIKADTSVGDHQVDLLFSVDQEVPTNHYKAVYIADQIYLLNGDTINTDKKQVKSEDGSKLKTKLFTQLNEFSVRQAYSQDQTQQTIRNLASTNVFKGVTIDFKPTNNDSSMVTQIIKTYTADRFFFATNTNLTAKNTGFIGPSLSLTAQQRNLFGEAENINFTIEGYYDFPMGINRNQITNSFGFNSSVNFSTPILSSPLWFIPKNSISAPRRDITLEYRYNNRTDFFEINNLSMTYKLDWKHTDQLNHELTVVNANYTYLPFKSDQFQATLDQNPILTTSFRDQLILGSAYKFTFDNTAKKEKRITNYYSTRLEIAGNLINGLNQLSGGNDATFLGVNFSQFIKWENDLRTYVKLKNRQQLAFKIVTGIGKAYGNSNVLPYIKKFYIGGNNSLRPATARTLGPGTYLQLNENAIDQVGDLKIDLSMEYRFHLVYKINGAVWLDGGNIWLLEEDENRPGSGLEINRIFKDSYLTSGVGIRYDAGFLIGRIDYGFLTYFPALNEGNRWLWQNQLPFNTISAIVFGIGYPF